MGDLVWFGLVLSTIVGYQYQIYFYAYKKFYLKQLSLA